MAVAVACADDPRPAGPPEIAWGEQECSHCRMILSDPRFAAAASGPGGVLVFDDVGCLLAARRSGVASGPAWVADRGSGDWLPATEAWFAVDSPEVTPMGSGTLAYAGRSEAEAAVRDGGRVARWNELAGLDGPAASETESTTTNRTTTGD